VIWSGGSAYRCLRSLFRNCYREVRVPMKRFTSWLSQRRWATKVSDIVRLPPRQRLAAFPVAAAARKMNRASKHCSDPGPRPIRQGPSGPLQVARSAASPPNADGTAN
jgi:hypothetical protein